MNVLTVHLHNWGPQILWSLGLVICPVFQYFLVVVTVSCPVISTALWTRSRCWSPDGGAMEGPIFLLIVAKFVSFVRSGVLFFFHFSKPVGSDSLLPSDFPCHILNKVVASKIHGKVGLYTLCADCLVL